MHKLINRHARAVYIHGESATVGSLTCRFYGRACVTLTKYNFGSVQREKASVLFHTQRATRITRRHDAEFYGCLISKFIQDEQAHKEFSSNNRASLSRQQTFSWQLDFPPKEAKLNFHAWATNLSAIVVDGAERLHYIHFVFKHSVIFNIA